MKILVTGYAGFVSGYLVEELSGAGRPRHQGMQFIAAGPARKLQFQQDHRSRQTIGCRPLQQQIALAVDLFQPRALQHRESRGTQQPPLDQPAHRFDGGKFGTELGKRQNGSAQASRRSRCDENAASQSAEC